VSVSRREVVIWATFLLAFPAATEVTALAASGAADEQSRPFVRHHPQVVQPGEGSAASR
jgi:hypothetical protein